MFKNNISLKTDIVVNAIANYLGSAESMPLSQRMAEVERRLAALEAHFIFWVRITTRGTS